MTDTLKPWPGDDVVTSRLRLYLRRSGSKGSPAVLLLHGYAVNGWMFGLLRNDLEPEFDLLVPDLRGHGLSDAPQQGWQAEDLADDIAALLDALSIPKIHTVGYSMGGFVALALAQRHPDRVDRLALLCTAPYSSSRRRRAGLAALEQLFRRLPPEAMLGITYRLLAGPNLPPEMREILPMIMRHNCRRGLSGGARLLRKADLRPGLSTMQHQCLLVTAEHDTAVFPRDWQALLDEVPSLRHEHFEGAGHGLAASHPKELSALLREFLTDPPDHETPPKSSSSL